jgi:D-glycero-beta-D-manno-heptose-7-phosphate kinase
MASLQKKLFKTRVLVVGDVMLDRYWFGPVERISPEAPVPIVRVSRAENRNGGAANVACNVVSLGASASLLSVIGEDEAGATLERLIHEAGIKTYFRRDPSLTTTVKLRVIGRNQQLLRLDFENMPTNELLNSQTKLFSELLPQHNAILFSDYGKGGLAHIQQMISIANNENVPIFVDPKGCDYSCYRGASVITPNCKELQQVIGLWCDEADLLMKVQKLRTELNLQGILLTRSEEGMTFFDEQGFLHVDAQAREVFDVTGAGDSVIAVLATLVGAGLSVREAVISANRAGGLVVGKFGTASVTFSELFAMENL